MLLTYEGTVRTPHVGNGQSPHIFICIAICMKKQLRVNGSYILPKQHYVGVLAAAETCLRFIYDCTKRLISDSPQL